MTDLPQPRPQQASDGCPFIQAQTLSKRNLVPLGAQGQVFATTVDRGPFDNLDPRSVELEMRVALPGIVTVDSDRPIVESDPFDITPLTPNGKDCHPQSADCKQQKERNGPRTQ